MDARTPTVIGLCGASGGLGTSTLAAAVAGLAEEVRRSALLVDLAPNSGGLDQLVGCAHEPGLRWPLREEGMFSLRSRDLPVWRGVRVLSQRAAVLPAPELGDAALEAVARIAGEHEVTVLDLPRPDHPLAPRWSRLCGTTVLVTGTTPTQLRAALATMSLRPQVDAVVLRPSQGCGLHPDDVAALLGAPLLQVLPHDPSVATAALDQDWPGAAGGGVRDAAAALLAAATESRRAAA